VARNLERRRDARVIEELIAEIAKEEGRRDYAYDDATGAAIVPGYTMVGHPTMWRGLCVEKGRMPRLPQKLPEDVLEIVVRSTVDKVLDRIPWLTELPEATQRGVFAMAYQIGVSGVMGFTDMIRALAVGNLTAAKSHALDSDWAQQTPARARRVAALIANEAADVNRPDHSRAALAFDKADQANPQPPPS
jgi:lysozyme